MTFLVEIRYREPTYEARHGARAEPYRWRYRVRAPSEVAATRVAVDEFHHMEVISAVGWPRDIVAIETALALATVA